MTAGVRQVMAGALMDAVDMRMGSGNPGLAEAGATISPKRLQPNRFFAMAPIRRSHGCGCKIGLWAVADYPKC
jgi:hypothetical protein